LNAVTQLVSHLRRGGLAVAGTPSTLEALERNQVDVLVMANTYQPPRGFVCKSCGGIDTATDRPSTCLRCGSMDLRPVNVKEAIVKQAERTGAEVEIVEHADVLMALGGVGCLLRYLTPEQSR
jgi:peptide subunit release factor 1 (eRF1)